MKMNVGGNHFEDVSIPVLWGPYAILQVGTDVVSIVDLSGDVAQLILLDGQPAEGIRYRPTDSGIEILNQDDDPIIEISSDPTILKDLIGRLPDCEITASGIRIGGAFFGGNVVVGAQVGLVITEQGIGMGARLPAGLADLAV